MYYLNSEISEAYLGVQQCFEVGYHELTTLRRVYFPKAALALAARTK